jgi:Mechanosensitive ion channel, conserved TM helix
MTVVVLLFAAEALDVMKLDLLTNLASQLLLWLPQVLIGLLILGVGVAVANWTERRVREGVPAERRAQRAFLALGARYAILAFVLAGALQQMGIAREVVVLASGSRSARCASGSPWPSASARARWQAMSFVRASSRGEIYKRGKRLTAGRQRVDPCTR